MSDRTMAMVMPMAGRGSRFARDGITLPKPLIELEGRPFFWWATESARRATPIGEMVFVVLEEHCRDHAIDRRIAEFYPDARILPIPQVTSGAAETASLGVRALAGTAPVAINDCDHAFLAPGLADAATALHHDAAGGLLCFRSNNPAYSYVRLDEQGQVVGTVEKKVASPLAITGCYMFSDPARFARHYDAYVRDCPYDELFVSGMFDRMAAQQERIVMAECSYHLPFGTPEERARVDPAALRRNLDWLAPR